MARKNIETSFLGECAHNTKRIQIFLMTEGSSNHQKKPRHYVAFLNTRDKTHKEM